MTLLEQEPMDGQGHRHVRAGPDRQVQVRLPCKRRGARINHDQLRALPLCLANVRHQVNTRHGRIGPPDHDEPRVAEVRIATRAHAAVHGRARPRSTARRTRFAPAGTPPGGTAGRRLCPEKARPLDPP